MTTKAVSVKNWLPALSAVSLITIACFPANAANSGTRICEQAAKRMQAQDRNVAELSVNLVDHYPTEAASSITGEIEDSNIEIQYHSKPNFDLSPRVASMLQRIFGQPGNTDASAVEANELLVAPTSEGVGTLLKSEEVVLENQVSGEEAAEDAVLNAVQIQERMLRIDI